MSRLHRGRKQLRGLLKEVAREQGIGLDHPDMADEESAEAQKKSKK